MSKLPNLVVILVIHILAAQVFPQNTANPDSRSNEEVALLWGVRIPLRDGVNLNATVYKPNHQSEPTPVIFTLTPYIGDRYHDHAMYFARHGYVFALVDVRGRGNSEGHFTPFQNDGKDGYDVVEWLEKELKERRCSVTGSSSPLKPKTA